MQTEQFAVLGAGLMGVGIATHFARLVMISGCTIPSRAGLQKST